MSLPKNKPSHTKWVHGPTVQHQGVLKLTPEDLERGNYLNCRLCRRLTWHDKMRNKQYCCSSCGSIHN